MPILYYLRNMFRKREPRNTGALIEIPEEGDFIAGEKTNIPYVQRIFDGDWTEYLPFDEWQWKFGFDSMSCVTFSDLNTLEMQINWMLATNNISKKARDFLYENYNIVDGKINFSDRFIAILSDTTKQGNYLKKVAQTVHEFGLIPESMLEFESVKNWEEYMDKDIITQKMKDLGKEFNKYFLTNYEWVVTSNGKTHEENIENTMHHMKHAPLQLAKDGHATAFFKFLKNAIWFVFDTYNPFRKEKPWNYTPPFILKIVITELPLYTEAEIVNAKFQINKMVKQHGNKYFFTPDIVEADGKKLGKAYMLLKDKDGKYDGSFKYGTAYGTIFRQMTTDYTIVPVGNDLWDQIKPAEIK